MKKVFHSIFFTLTIWILNLFMYFCERLDMKYLIYTLKGLSLNNQRNACTKCKSNENSDKSKNCDKCRKIRLTKMSEKIGRNKIKKNCWTCQRCKRKFNQMGKRNF